MQRHMQGLVKVTDMSCEGHMQLLHFTVSEASNYHYFILFFCLQEILPDSQEESWYLLQRKQHCM